MSIKEQMNQVVTKLKAARGKMAFDKLFETHEKAIVVATFLSLLELMKRQMIQVHQGDNFTTLEIELTEEVFEHEMDSEFDESN